MVTRCPSCGTLFRVTPQHLQAHQGQVRCGRCMTVFDGFNALATLPDQGALEPAPRSETEPAANTGGARLAVPRPGAPDAQAEPESATWSAGQSHSADATRTVAVEHDAAPAEPVAGAVAYAASAQLVAQSDPQAAGSGQAEAKIERGRRRRALGWSVGIAILLLGLAGQAIYAWRVDLVASYPGLKPAVAQFCELLGCVVPLPQRPTLITIEASDLQVQDPTRPGAIQLTATLRNHAGFDVGYPALDLVLTNTKEHTLARRVFLPAEYLEPRRDGLAGLAANAEVTVRLMLDTGDLGPAGFRLGLLPAR